MSTRYSRPSSRDYPHTRRTQRPSSTSMEDPGNTRFSLPSISSLIEAADEGTGRERMQIDPRLQKVVVDPQLLAQGQQRAPLVKSRKISLPPTPPSQPASVYDARGQSPAVKSSHSAAAAVSGLDRRVAASAINDVDAYSQRQMNYPPIPQDRPLRPLQGPVSPYAGLCYGSPATASTTGSYQGSPIEASYPRSLPANFPPSSYDESSGQYISHATPAWQHHHHFPHSASTPYPPNQDRYICGTCNKAFSRPSSLKIHTYSHTGEKPWKCEMAGCGKTFSVRSNMKRHEKGCHGEGGYSGSGMERNSPESMS